MTNENTKAILRDESDNPRWGGVDAYDLVVIGGGTAGSAAAAARRGCRVLLVEELNGLGGVSTSGGVAELFAGLEGLGDIFNHYDWIPEAFLTAVNLYRPSTIHEKLPALVMTCGHGDSKSVAHFDHASPIIGLRETRCIAGDYVLTVDDLRAGRAFDDAVARGVFYLDGMRPDDEKRTYFLSKEEQRVPPYHLPFRSLIARDADNLLMAGRCLSADQLALSSARVMTTCAMMGQAAGIAAAWSVSRGCQPRELDGTEIRRRLESCGADLDISDCRRVADASSSGKSVNDRQDQPEQDAPATRGNKSRRQK